MADPLILQRRDLGVEGDVGRAEPGVGVNVVGDLLAQSGDAVALNIDIPVQLAPAHPPLCTDGITDGVKIDVVDADVFSVEEQRVLGGMDVVAELPGLDHIGTVGDVVILGPGLAVSLNDVARRGIHGLVLGQLQQVGRRVQELDL